METDNILNSQFIDEDDAMYQILTDFDDDNEDTSSDDEKDYEYKVTPDTNLYRFFKTELQIIEPNRNTVKFKKYGDSKVAYEGKVLKEVDRDHFIILLSKPETKMMKFDINDIEVVA